MRILSLILRKDLRHFRLPLLLWPVLITLRELICFQITQIPSGDLSARERLLFFVYLLFGIESVVGFILASAIAKDDAPRGTTAFWMTRPLSGLRLLCGKLTSVASLTILWPILFMLPWQLSKATHASALPFTLQSSLEWTASIALAGFFLGAFTTSFGQMVGWALGLPIAASIGTAIWSSWIENPSIPQRAQAASPIEIWAIVAAGALISLFLLYRNRRLPTALAVLGVFFAAALTVGLFGR